MKQPKFMIASITTILIMSLFFIILGLSSSLVFQETIDGYREGYKNGVVQGIKQGITAFDHAININMPLRTYFIDAYGGFQRVLGAKVIEDVDPSNTVYKMPEGILTFGYQEMAIAGYANDLIDFVGFLKTEKIPVVYLQAPFKLSGDQSLLPNGLEEFSNKNTDQMIKRLEEAGVDTVDLRELRDNIPDEAAFYRTDHHWRPEYALESLRLISPQLASQTAQKILMESDAFEAQPTLDFLGSQGHRVGRYYTGLDSFQLLVPTFETDFLVRKYPHVKETTSGDEIHTDASSYIQTDGDFESAIVEGSKLKPQGLSDRFSAYFGGNFALTEITNRKVDEGNIVVFSDSFGRPFNGFLSCYINQLTVIDQRYYEDSVREHILKMNQSRKIDYVIILYNPSLFDPLSSNSYKMFEFK